MSSPQHPLWARRTTLAALMVAVLAAITFLVLRPSPQLGPPELVVVAPVGDGPAPQDWLAPAWVEILTLEDGYASAAPEDLEGRDGSNLSGAEFIEAQDTARAALTELLTGELRDNWSAFADTPAYIKDPFADLAGTCTNVDVDAVGAAELPEFSEGITGRYVKTALLWTGECPELAVMSAALGEENPGTQLAFIYLRDTGEGFVPVRETQVPGSAAGVSMKSPPSLPPSLLVDVGECAEPGVRAVPDVAGAWAQMCAAANADGVDLLAVDGYRTPAEQQQRFDAVESQLGRDEAERRVAFSDGVSCESRHCAGAAFTVAPDADQLAWLNTTVGCVTSDGIVDAPDSGCPQRSTPLARSALYGFTSPIPTSPRHFAYVLASADLLRTQLGCEPSPWASIPEQVIGIWRCRLGAAGVPAEDVVDAVGDALVVSRCASGWNPAAVVDGGRFRFEPDPRTGEVRDGTGVFALGRDTADEWVQGGFDHVTDPARNIDAAARIYLDRWIEGEGSFEGFECGDLAAESSPEWVASWVGAHAGTTRTGT